MTKCCFCKTDIQRGKFCLDCKNGYYAIKRQSQVGITRNNLTFGRSIYASREAWIKSGWFDKVKPGYLGEQDGFFCFAFVECKGKTSA